MKKLLLLPVMLLGLVAMSGMAQAEEPAQWSVLGKPITKPLGTLTVGTFALLQTVSGGKHIICTTVHDSSVIFPGGANTNPFEAGAGTDENLIRFSNCKDLALPGNPNVIVAPVLAITFLVRVAPGVIADLNLPCTFFETGSKVFTEVEDPEGTPPQQVIGEEPVAGIVVGNKLVYNEKFGNLTLGGEEAEFVTEVEQEVAAGEEDEGESVTAE